jgi:N-acyl-D-amino-acid deacylase
MRDEGDRVMESLEETFRIGREVGVTVLISHHKVFGENNRGRSEQTLAFIRKNMALQPICLDCYPYTAGSTILSWSAPPARPA